MEDNNWLNVVQFVPYYPPNKNGVGIHAHEWWKYWIKKWYGKVFVVTTNIGQKITDFDELVVFEGETIGYYKDGVEVLLVPGKKKLSGFYNYKKFSKEYLSVQNYLNSLQVDIVITRTRYFPTSYEWLTFARRNNICNVHIEHSSDYVNLPSKIKTWAANIYDKVFWKKLMKNTDKIIPISYACKEFVENNFGINSSEVVYRWVETTSFLNEIKYFDLKQMYPEKIIIGFVGRLYKWKNVDSLIRAYYELPSDLQEKVQIVIVWDWEDFWRLKSIDAGNYITFLGELDFDETMKTQKQFDIFFHCSSKGGGFPISLLQWMRLGCFPIASPYEWAKEVITNDDNWILLEDDTKASFVEGIEKALEMLDYKEDYARKNKELINNYFDRNNNITNYYKIFSDMKNLEN